MSTAVATPAYEAARGGAAVATPGGRGLLEVSGPQRQKFLQAMLSNEVAGLAPGQGRRAALLSVKGQITTLLRVMALPDKILLEMPQDRVAGVEATLQHYRVAAPVRFAPRGVDSIVLVGPEAVPVVRKAGAALPDLAPEAHAETNIGGHGVLVVAAGDLPADGLLLHAAAGEGDAVAAVLRDAGAVLLDLATLDVLRIEDGRPWFGPDVKADNLLHETGLEAEYASFTKGCYVGQEVVARLQARGANVNKALRGLRLAAPAAAGALVQADGAEVGTVTTAGVSPSLGPIAMAMIRRSHLPPGSVVQVGNVPATVEALPLRAR